MRLRALLLVAFLVPASLPGGEVASPAGSARRKGSMRDLVQARMLEEAKKKPAPALEAPAKPAGTAGAAAPAESSEAGPAPAAEPVPPQPVMLPQVEVRKGRITELDQQLAKQDQAIAREKKNLTPSEPDKAMNDLKIAKPLAIFGGESAQFRQHVASERVELMEAEKDLLEAIAHARTQAEKDELQKQLNELKAIRRDLDRTLR